MARKVLLFLLISLPLIFAEWKLDWSDEFEGDTLDTSKWDYEINCWGGGNLEKQCYVNNKNNVYVRDGALHIRPIAGTYQGKQEGCTLNNENSCTWTQPATSGRIRTLRSTDGHWTYGKFEIRAKLPKGDFLWPAAWLLPTDLEYGVWAGSGEIDIMEFRGQDRKKVSHAIHFGGPWPNNRYYGSGNIEYNFDFTEDYHVFGLEWTKENLIFTVDGRESHRESLQRSFGSMYTANGQPFDKRFHMILNVAVGGNFFDPAIYGNFDISKSSTWTQPYSIDYVRVYKWEENSTSPPVSEPEPNAPISDDELSIIPLIPAADGFIDNTKPKQSFGKDSVLLVKSVGDDSRSAYLKFFVPNIDVESVSLLLYGGLDSASPSCASISVYGIPNEWTDSSLTYETKLERGNKIVSSEVNSKQGWYSFDISDYVKEQISSGKNVISIEVASDEEANALFNSAEADLNQPLLRICL